MAIVPKGKVSKARRNSRKANWKTSLSRPRSIPIRFEKYKYNRVIAALDDT